MAAYAALVSLDKTLENFVQTTQDLPKSSSSVIPASLNYFFQDMENYIQENQQQTHHQDQQRDHFVSVHQKVIMLKKIFDNFPRRVCNWEAEIRDQAIIFESSIEILSYGLRLDCMRSNYKDTLYLLIEKLGVFTDLIFTEIKSNVDLSADEGDAKPPAGNQNYGNHRNFGLDHHMSKIRQRLISHESHVQILPIVGMGGIGKTTLARAVFDDPAVRDIFDLHRWVTVSQNYSAKSILQAILGDKSLDETTGTEELGIRINQLLYHRRYLIILDDIWDLTAWDEVQMLLRKDDNRSRVVLTTRNEDVASYTTSSRSIYHLPLMNKETSWSLLQYSVFGEEPCPPELIEIGQEIGNGCQGLPLAILVVAGILANVNLNKESWENIAKDVKEAIRTSGDQFSEILALSYYHLPHHLRPCFLYMGAFPRGRYISVSNLLQLWVAEGFLKADNKYGDIEEIAYNCLQELLKRNLIMATKKKYNGRTKLCGIHDLLRDLSINKAQEEMFLLHNYTSGAEKTTTCRAIFRTDASAQFMRKPSHLIRSAFCFCDFNDLLSWLEDCMLLRVLDASASTPPLWKLPSQLTRFIHLRFLSLKRAPGTAFEFPPDIHKLENLETLILTYHYLMNEVRKLIIPAEIWRLPKLRHLRLFPEWDLLNPTESTSSLVNLESLQEIRNFRLTEETVKLIPNVKKLVLNYQINPTTETWSGYCLNNLYHLDHLENLRLKFVTQDCDSDWCNQIPLMKILNFPPSLKVLKLEGGAGRASSWEDMSRIVGALPNLQVLKLGFEALSGDVWEAKEEDFQSLRVLKICGCYLKCWRTESSNSFPRLEHLVLIACPYLTELPDSFGEIPTLQTITVDDHQEAIVNWAEQIEEEQRDLGNDYFKVLVNRYTEVMKGEEPEKAKSKVLEMWKAANGDSAMLKMALHSMFADDNDGFNRIAEMIYRDLYENKQQNDLNPSQV